jgi:hypothetical protein
LAAASPSKPNVINPVECKSRHLPVALSHSLAHQEPTMSTPNDLNRTDRIRALNDDLRRNFSNGNAVITVGVATLGSEAVARIIKTVEVYDDFCQANDPHQEHDFGSFVADGKTIFFKIDYYDNALTNHSPDPTDSGVTERVITIMLAEEY